MAKKLLIRDLTLRDGQQSLFATRLNQSQIDRVLPDYKKAGFYAMEVWGGAVPDSVMRFLDENPWERLQKISKEMKGISLLTALSRGRNLFGYTPYPENIIKGFCQESVEQGLGIMRIFDALNDESNIETTIRYIKESGGLADGAICYTVDPYVSGMDRFKALLKGKKLPKKIFTDEYFVNKALVIQKLGADMISLKDMAGLISPSRVASLMPKLKKQLNVPVDFHTHCTPGYGLASTLMAILHDVDIVDTNIWYFSGGSAAPALELIYIFCQKLGIEVNVNMEAVAAINAQLAEIRKELAPYDIMKIIPNPFNPVTDKLPAEIDARFDAAIQAGKANDETAMLAACHAIEAYFNFPKPNAIVQAAQIPGGMYTNMVLQLKQMNLEELLNKSLELVPQVRLKAGLAPLVTPSSQIVGSQAVSCAVDLQNGKPMFTTLSNQFISLVKGEYGKTPIPIDPAFRKQITGSPQEQPYDASKYQSPENPTVPGGNGELLAANKEELLLLQLFPTVATGFLKKIKTAKIEKAQQDQNAKIAATKEEEAKKQAKAIDPITGPTIDAPLGGKIIEIHVTPGDVVKKHQSVLILESMKMENDIFAEFSGTVKRILVNEGDIVMGNTPMIEFE